MATALIDAARKRLVTAGGDADLFATVSTAPPGKGKPVYPIDLVRAARGAIGGGHRADAELRIRRRRPRRELLRDLERDGPIGRGRRLRTRLTQAPRRRRKLAVVEPSAALTVV